MASKLTLIVSYLMALAVVDAAPMPTGAWPTSAGSITRASAIVVPAGTTFDGKMQTYERSDVTCKGQTSSNETSMFIVEPGATLKNVIIGRNQMEGVLCEKNDCTIENVWFSDVCEDAVSIKGGSIKSTSSIIGGGARYADDKIVVHSGAGSVVIDGFFAEDFGTLYRSCSSCGAIQRTVNVSNVLAMHPNVNIVAVNSNFGDIATLSNIRVDTLKASVEICAKMVGVFGAEPKKVGSGPDSTTCRYTAKDIVIHDASAKDASGSQQQPPTKQPLPSTPAPVNGTADKPLTPQPQQPVSSALLPGRVQAPPTLGGLPQTPGSSTPSAGSAPAVNVQSLSFNPAPAPTTQSPSAALPPNSYGFRAFAGRAARG